MARVLVIDNDDGIRQSARFILEDAGYEIEEAPDGMEGLTLLRTFEEARVVLLDVAMPHLNGVQVLRLMNDDERLARHSFVVWSASRGSVPADLLAAHNVPFISKPFDIDELIAVVEQAAARLDGGSSAQATDAG
jgi:CheY-like chemotaxis protein